MRIQATTIPTTEKVKVAGVSAAAIVVCVLLAACGADERILKSGKETSTTSGSSERREASVDQEVAAMRDADFRFIWVLRRKDGGVLDADDKAVIRANTVDMNRRVLAEEAPCPDISSDNGNNSAPLRACPRAAVIGTNALPPRKNIDALFGYFAVEDNSPVPMPPANSNSNSKGKK